MPLTARVHRAGGSYGVESAEIKSIDYGFAFSGSVLGAMSVYSWSTAILSNLVPHSSLPADWETNVSIDSVVAVLRKVSADVFFKSCEMNSGSNSPDNATILERHGFKILLFGYDRDTDGFVVYEVSTDFDEQNTPIATYKKCVLSSESDRRTFFIGSKRFGEVYSEAKDSGDVPNLEAMLQEIFSDTSTPNVGGHVMAGVAMKSRFVVLPVEKNNISPGCFSIMGEDNENAILDGLIISMHALPIPWDI